MSVRLRPFAREDFAALLAWIGSEEDLVRWSGPRFAWPLTEEQLERYLVEGSHVAHSLVAVEDRSLLGHAGVKLGSDGVGQIGNVLLGPEARGRRLCRELMRLTMADAFGRLGLAELRLWVFEDNFPAIACYRGAGFEPGAERHEARLSDGRTMIAFRMSVQARSAE